MYSIDFCRSRNLVDIRWAGLFRSEAVNGYAEELEHRFLAAGFRTGYRLRMDMSAATAQPLVAVSRIHERLRGFPKASRIAVVAASSITHLQVRHYMKQDYLRLFDAPAPALDWLMAA
ncbi:STAS/SEC14 domain-containing protein [Sphingomonas aracearum]|uniref:STAS/SEC14 domain-containing protein n=2 Tax=Sphingomonas aracearum TaxID=2283317 RepID=A0A369W2B1_9SPHN|nr:STAS/SEC14 domain-containing protein [Sphingomonas aracearum]